MPIYKNDDGRYVISVQLNNKRSFSRMPKGATKAQAKEREAVIYERLKATAAEDKKKQARWMREGEASDPNLGYALYTYYKYAETRLRSPQKSIEAARRIEPYIDGLDRASDAPKVVARFISENSHLRPATLNKSINCLKRGLRILFENGRSPIDYAARVKRLPEDNVCETYTPASVAEEIALCASPKVALAIRIAYLTGCRRGEILQMRPEDIEGDTLVIHASHTKTNVARRVPITPKLRPLLAQLPVGLTPDGFKSSYNRARKKAGYPTVGFHTIRHGVASTLIQNGISLFEVSRVLGHSSLASTKRYAKLELEHVRKAMEIL